MSGAGGKKRAKRSAGQPWLDCSRVPIGGDGALASRIDPSGECGSARRADAASAPAGDYFTLKGEIKNVLTAVAKTTHYWGEHVPDEVKHAFQLQAQLERLRSRVLRWVGRRTAR